MKRIEPGFSGREADRSIVESDTEMDASESRGRRRTVLAAALGLGAASLPEQWIRPLVQSTAVPAHAQSTAMFPTGRFGSDVLVVDNHLESELNSLAERSESEILDLFIRTSRANGCSPVCEEDSALTVDVVATITTNPSAIECLQARVRFANELSVSCTPTCEIIDFQPSVNGSSMSVAPSCGLALTNLVLTESMLTGSWSYTAGNYNQSGSFTSNANPAGGCEAGLSCSGPPT